MKKFLALVLGLSLVLTLVACGNSGSSTEEGKEQTTETTTAAPTDEELAEDAVKETLNGIEKADALDFFYYFLDGDEVDTSDTELTEKEKEIVLRIHEAALKPFNYKIISSEKSGENLIEVKLEVTSIDGTKTAEAFGEKLLTYIFSIAFSDPQPSDQEISEESLDLLATSIEEAVTITTEKTIDVTLVDGEWVVDFDNGDIGKLVGDNFADKVDEISDEIENSAQ